MTTGPWPVYLLRHGETEWNLRGRYQGRGHATRAKRPAGQNASAHLFLLPKEWQLVPRYAHLQFRLRQGDVKNCTERRPARLAC